MPRIPDRLLRQPEWAAIGVIITECFPHDQRVWSHIDLDAGWADFEAILENQTFSTSERVLLTAAASLWSLSGHPVSLGWIANSLGDGTLRVLLKALSAARQGPLPL